MNLNWITSRRRRSNVAALIALAIVTALASVPVVVTTLGSSGPEFAVPSTVGDSIDELATVSETARQGEPT